MSLSISNQLEELEKQIMKKLGDNGLDPLADLIKEVGKKKVKQEVYSAYSPLEYERTYKLESDWGVNKVNPMTIGVYSDRWDGNRYVSGIVESGEGYQFKPRDGSRGAYERPRPFFQATVDEVKQTNLHVIGYATALGRAGFRTRMK